MDLNEKMEEVSLAAQVGDADRLLDILQAVPALANSEDGNGITPLGYAAHYGHIETVKVLLQCGAEPNALSNSKVPYIPSNTALHAAIAGKRSLEVIRLLLEHNASPAILDSNGYNSLHVAAFHNEGEPVVRLLLEYGAPVHAENREGKTALIIAVEQSNHQTADVLRETGSSAQ